MGSDTYDAALDIYLPLKAFGKSMGLDELRKGVGSLFAKSRRKAKVAPQGE